MIPLDTFVSVVLPLRNDAAILEPYVREVVATLKTHFRDYEVILVDDASTDATCAVLDRLLGEAECLRLICLSRPFGLDVATAAGLETAIGDCVAVAEPGRDPPSEIPRLVAQCQEGHDIVIGTSARRAQDGPLFRLGRAAFFWLCRRLIAERWPSNATRFAAFSRRAANAISRIKQRHRHLGILACSVGYTMAYFPYEQRPALHKPARRGLAAALHYGATTLVSHSLYPLRFVTAVGVCAGLANLLYMVYVVLVNLFKDKVVEGWTTLSLQMAGMFFLVFVALAVISEYLAHTFEESKDEPLYHVREERSSLQAVAAPGRRNVVYESRAS